MKLNASGLPDSKETYGKYSKMRRLG